MGLWISWHLGAGASGIHYWSCNWQTGDCSCRWTSSEVGGRLHRLWTEWSMYHTRIRTFHLTNSERNFAIIPPPTLPSLSPRFFIGCQGSTQEDCATSLWTRFGGFLTGWQIVLLPRNTVWCSVFSFLVGMTGRLDFTDVSSFDLAESCRLSVRGWFSVLYGGKHDADFSDNALYFLSTLGDPN